MTSVATHAPGVIDSDDYNPIDHLNSIFSHPSTLPAVSEVSLTLQDYQDELDEEIADRAASRAASNNDSVKRIQDAKAELAELFARIEGVQERARQTEQTIAEMTADIKRLDQTKRNLTLSMTALKRLQMLTTAYEQLRGLSKTRQYRECASLLQAVLQLMAHFKSYRSIDQIASLSRNVSDLQRELLEQVCEDFEMSFARGDVPMKKNILAEGCLVMDALGDHARARIVTWYCNTQLREYRQVFRGSEEAGSLDNISRRYSWFNRMLKTYDAEHAVIFPTHWRVGEMLANSFCEGTREDFKGILQRHMRRTDGQTLDVNLLLSCLQETLNFEHSLERRFSGESRSSVDTMNSRDERPHLGLSSISEAFEPYMTLWVDSQDRQLATLIQKYRQQPLRSQEEEFSPQAVISSSTELFNFYRLSLAQCAKLSTGNRLLELSKTFAKYLDQYGQQVLFYFLGERAGPAGPPIEGIIMILNTADYCYTTCNQLEEKIKARIDEDHRGEVDLQNQADAFMGIASAAVRALVKKVEIDIDPIWREMRNMPWGTMENVGDSSGYVAEMLRIIKASSSSILHSVQKQQYARAFCDHLIESVAALFVMNVGRCKPVSEVGAEQMLLDSYVLRKGLQEIPNINAEVEEGKPPPQPSAAFIKRATQSMAKIDILLKTLQVRPSPPEALVQAYLIHIADRSETNFKKLLDLKGLSTRKEQSHLVDLFNAHCGAPNYASLPASGPLLSNLQIITASSAGATGLSALKDAPNVFTTQSSNIAAAAGRFDAATFGSAIINAAKEGVDRFGSPALGLSNNHGSNGSGSNTSMTGVPSSLTRTSMDSNRPSGDGVSGVGGLGALAAGGGTDGGVTGANASSTNLNDNLQKIGKFFRRDTGFGRFGKGGSETK